MATAYELSRDPCYANFYCTGPLLIYYQESYDEELLIQ